MAKELTVNEVGSKNEEEKALAGDATAGLRARGLLGVQRVEKRGHDKLCRPNHRWR